METFQKVYRSRLPADELAMWRDTLKDYSVQEFDAAFADLVEHPPKYELEDGTIQVWRGMPKLPDVVQVMLGMREKAIQQAHKRDSDRQRKEMAELAKRREEHPEEFMSWADFCKRLADEKPELAAKMGMAMPNVRTIFPDIDPGRNAEKLRQQAEMLKGQK